MFARKFQAQLKISLSKGPGAVVEGEFVGGSVKCLEVK